MQVTFIHEFGWRLGLGVELVYRPRTLRFASMTTLSLLLPGCLFIWTLERNA